MADLLYVDDGPASRELRSGISGLGLGVAPAVAPRVLAGAVSATLGLLSMPISDLLWWAAESEGRIRQAMDRTSKDHKSREVVTLSKQHLESHHRPQVMVEYLGVDTHLFDLDLSVDLTIDSLVAEIQGGELRKLRAGKAESKAALELVDPSGRRRVPVFSRRLASIELS